MQGGKFSDGFKFAAFTSSMAVTYEKVVGFEADIRPGENRPGQTTYTPDSNGQIKNMDRSMNVFGTNEPLSGNFWDDFGKQGGFVSKVGNAFPGGEAVARWHDTIFNNGSIMMNGFNNVWTMAPATIVTYGALLNNPMAIQAGLHEGAF